ncbi:fatty acid 2-hydroxylase [Salpingoeca rosetta]|uniref:Fatty acid 2-hydroxylase n=1 Tax=Salpingoeca rosetta (strain ATCC 50818 / BSB-021) TaxID=946362 RepID=F2UT37_SALR5|nr:fatty acid 2-hydroxylase [Salpingoeca rosetta]EGD81296.1 fatty acid 2-hydroxylase [Salpingoeca rosetta]|eukprot:XP_004987692.1 fatty acid 2-hydroxylase [Salpingoeca rosetta]
MAPPSPAPAAMGRTGAARMTTTATAAPAAPAARAAEMANRDGKKAQLDEGLGVVDMKGPMVPQVAKLGDKYWEWVHKPSAQRSYRLFAGDLYEFFSWTPWWVIPIVWVPIITALSMDALGRLDWSMSPLALVSPAMVSTQVLALWPFLGIFLTGILMWSFLEYCLHRFLFHIILFPGTAFGIQFHFILHGQHHKFPLDRGRLVFPPMAGLMMTAPFYLVFHLTMAREVANALTAGALLGYIAYDLTHYYLHHGRPSTGYFQRLKRHHMQHHYRHSTLGFGISSKLWDFPFATLTPSSATRT